MIQYLCKKKIIIVERQYPLLVFAIIYMLLKLNICTSLREM